MKKDSRAKSSASKLWNLWLTAVVVFVLDRLTKSAVLGSLAELPFDIGPVSIVYSTNTGVTWGFLQGYPFIPFVVATGVIIAIVIYHKKIPMEERVLAGLVLGGAAGNLVDRILYGAVIDWIDVGWWPIFNVADSAITIAMVWIVYKSFISDEHSSARK